MAKKRLRVLLLACATVLVCLALIIAGSYALFSDSTKVTNHLQAGTLDITLIRESYSSKYLNDDGLLETRTGGEYDFSNPTTTNIFGLEDDAMIAPRSVLVANMVLSNNSNVAFDYWIDIVVGDGYLDSALANQLKVTVITDTIEQEFQLSRGYTLGGENGIALVKVGESHNFTVKIEFEDRETGNNVTMGQKVIFDFVVRAVQTTQEA